MKKLTWDVFKWHMGHAAAGQVLSFAVLAITVAVKGVLTDNDILVAAGSSTILGLIMETVIAGKWWGPDWKDSLTDIWQYSYSWCPCLVFMGMWQWGLAAFALWVIVYLITFYSGWTKP